MKKKAVFKKITLVAGILAAVVILFSQAFQKETNQILSKIKTEKNIPKGAKSKQETEKKVVVSASTDAVTSGSAVQQVQDVDASVIREIVFDEDNTTGSAEVVQKVLGNFFKTLFRVFISPQAP